MQRVWGERKNVHRVRGLLNQLNRAGVRDADVARKLGVGKSTVSQWRSGRSKPHKDRERELVAMLDVLTKLTPQRTPANSSELSGKNAQRPIQNENPASELSANFQRTSYVRPYSGDEKNARRPVQNGETEPNTGQAYNINVNKEEAADAQAPGVNGADAHPPNEENQSNAPLKAYWPDGEDSNTRETPTVTTPKDRGLPSPTAQAAMNKWAPGAKPLATCQKCPYLDRPFVGGRRGEGAGGLSRWA